MNHEDRQGPDKEFLFDFFPDAPFGQEAERRRILDEREAAEQPTLVARIRQEIAERRAGHE